MGIAHCFHYICDRDPSLSHLVKYGEREIAVVTGPSIGGLLNAVFGNATKLIIALVALNEGLFAKRGKQSRRF